MSVWSPVHPAPAAISARLWRALTHPLWVVVLAVVTALLLAGYLWLPQLPGNLAADPSARSLWLDETAAAWPGRSLAQALGLFDIARSFFTRMVVALLAVALLLRAIDRIRLAQMSRWLGPPVRQLPLTSAREWSAGLPDPSQGPPPNLLDGLRPHVRREQALTASPSGGSEWCGDRHHRHAWASLLVEGGLLLAVLAVVLVLRTGWQFEGIDLDPGQSAGLQPYSPATLALDSDGAVLRLCCDPDRSAPLGSGGFGAPSLRITEQQIGASLLVTATIGDRNVPIQVIEQSGAPTEASFVHFPLERSERAVIIPERNLFLRFVQTGDAAYTVQALDSSNNVLLTQETTGAADLTLDDLTVRLLPSRYVTLAAQGRPWLWLLIPALLLTLVGCLVRWRYPYLRLGARFSENGFSIRWQGQDHTHPPLDDIARQIVP